jgi:hypothetical protein
MMHFYTYHQEHHELSNFRLTKYGKPSSWCKQAYREDQRKKYREGRAKELKASRDSRILTCKICLNKKPLLEFDKFNGSTCISCSGGNKKRCTKCNIIKPRSEFSERRDRPGKLHSYCISCRRKLTKAKNLEYKNNNVEKLAQWRKHYQATHPGYNDQSVAARRARFAQIRQILLGRSYIMYR